MSFALRLAASLRRRGKAAFIRRLDPNATLLDVGCGNDAPRYAKSLNPSIHYTGLDIVDYDDAPEEIAAADEFIRTPSAEWAATIAGFGPRFDGVLSSHNLEHCEDQQGTVRAMCAALKPGGHLYLAFPTDESVNFPSRRGTLNFYDDDTHRVPPGFDRVGAWLEESGMEIEYRARRYRPLVLAAVGAVLEPIEAIRKANAPLGATWALYGFESVFWARRPGPSGEAR
jgi:SAM-dependent methyltransferase